MSKDDLLVAIARGLVALPRLHPDWRSLAIVFTVRGRYPSNFGYCYTGPAAEDWAAFTNREDDLDDDVVSLREEMAAQTGRRWTQALFRLHREGAAIDAEFAYDGEPWRVRPADPDPTIQALRPRPPDR